MLFRLPMTVHKPQKGPFRNEGPKARKSLEKSPWYFGDNSKKKVKLNVKLNSPEVKVSESCMSMKDLLFLRDGTREDLNLLMESY